MHNSVTRVAILYRTARIQRMSLLWNVPAMGSQRETPEAERIIYAHLYEPYGHGRWYIAEFNGHDTFWGAVKQGGAWRWGAFNLSDLEGLAGSLFGGAAGKVELDPRWKPVPFSEANQIAA